MRERIYAVSPAFAELRPFLDGDVVNGWSKWGPYAGRDISTHFVFALRDAVASAGYYSSGVAAAAYYRRLASEVNTACDKGLLECYGKDNSIIPKSAYKLEWHKEYLEPLIVTFATTFISVSKLGQITMYPRPTSDGIKSVSCLYMDITRDRIAPVKSDSAELPAQEKVDSLKISVLDSFLSFFRFYLFPLTILGLLSYIWQFVLIVFRHKIDFSFVITTALLLGVLSRIFLISLLDVTQVPDFAQISVYRSSLFPLLAAFSIFSVLIVFIKTPKEFTFTRILPESKK
jgi:hypothetical protein